MISSRRLAVLTLTAALALFGVACSGSDSDADAAAGKGGGADGATEIDSEGAEDTDDDAGSNGSGDAPVIDICARFTAEDFEAIMGKPSAGPEVLEARGSFLGSCDHSSEDATTSVSISLRPADEYDGTVEMYDGSPVQVEGSAEAHFSEEVGLFALADGDDWFLHVLAFRDITESTATDEDDAIAAAEAFFAG